MLLKQLEIGITCKNREDIFRKIFKEVRIIEREREREVKRVAKTEISRGRQKER